MECQLRPSQEPTSQPAPAGRRYVVITPARNEARLIEETIKAVVAQAILPQRYVVVSDGSTDGTDEIVQRYAASHPWITLVRTPERAGRSFAGKVHAFNAGYATLGDLAYDVIGNLDADITFDANYFEFLLERFAEDARLGVAGTPFREGNHQYDYRFTNIEHVSGACQMFRRACFEDIGGYKPLKGGGIDWMAVTSARMRGWRTRTFTEQVCHHHRAIGTAQHSELTARFRQGRKDYALGGHPLWQVFRSAYQMKCSPVLAGGACLMAGYTWAWITRTERAAAAELIDFHRREQLARLRSALRPRPRHVAVDSLLEGPRR
ncbi:MAG: glycosyltransferase family 2 protein [Caulobacter sp.]|nr:glycosyltransferase family 2 protein [Vitreoscilla sp.]